MDPPEAGGRAISLYRLFFYFNKEYSSSYRFLLYMVTFVTGLWDIGRDGLKADWARSYQHYLDKFSSLLSTDANFIIFGEEELEKFVWRKRPSSNTQFILRNRPWFKNNVPYAKIQEIRKNASWLNLASWLKDSTQARLEWYNPLVMSKMFLLNDAQIMSKFDSSHYFWIDAGICNTVSPGYFSHDKIHLKLPKTFQRFAFIAFPYEASTEIHGFSFPKLNEYAGSRVRLVCRGGLFGGRKETIPEINGLYHSILHQTLNDGYMGTEESIFSILLYRYPKLFEYAEIESNGLINHFCERLKNNTVEVKSFSPSRSRKLRVGLYILTFNSPTQLGNLLRSMKTYDPDFLEKPELFVLDNSTDPAVETGYLQLQNEFRFQRIKKDNLGVCGGRQFIAEHAEEMKFDFYFFFEDDMLFYLGEETACKNGFIRKIAKLYSKSLHIIYQENLDFLKLNFTEFFGDNGKQWSWHNVPQGLKNEYWPDHKDLSKIPDTRFERINSYQGLSYATGEIYYCNWPQVVSRKGNQKIFLDTKWKYPFEQTWMSHVYQKLKKQEITSGLLLASPTEHDRTEFYSAEMRREN